MDLDPLLLSRIQFAFTISFHIIFPVFTIGLAAWLATMEAMHIATVPQLEILSALEQNSFSTQRNGDL